MRSINFHKKNSVFSYSFAPLLIRPKKNSKQIWIYEQMFDWIYLKSRFLFPISYSIFLRNIYFHYEYFIFYMNRQRNISISKYNRCECISNLLVSQKGKKKDEKKNKWNIYLNKHSNLLKCNQIREMNIYQFESKAVLFSVWVCFLYEFSFHWSSNIQLM